MTETQRKWLLKYIDKEWLHTDFTTAQDKQDLLEAIIRKNEWYSVVWDMNGELMESQSGEFAGFKNYAKAFLFAQSDSNESFTIKLILLSPLETADLICRWKGKE